MASPSTFTLTTRYRRVTRNGSVYLLPGSKAEIPVTFSLFLYGYYPGVYSTVVGGELLNVTTGYLPVNGTDIEVRAYLVQTLGTESFVVFEDNHSFPPYITVSET